jgi:hypothetical protein
MTSQSYSQQLFAELFSAVIQREAGTSESTSGREIIGHGRSAAENELITQLWHLVIFVCLLSCVLLAQVVSSGAPQAGTASATPVDAELNGLLRQIEGLASSLNLELGELRVEKWKIDSASKRQAESNIDSVQRNLSAALPGFVTAVRSAPRNVATGFRLYRNLSALSEVLNSIAESAGAFGPKGEFERLAADVNGLDAARAALGKRVESLAEAQTAELARLRKQLLQAQAKAQPPAPVKVIVDDSTASKPKSTARKKPKPDAPEQKPKPDASDQTPKPQ